MTEQAPISVPPDDVKPNLATTLALLQTKLPQIAKNQTADVKNNEGRFLYSYDFADLADVSEVVLPLLGDMGLSWTCRPTLNERGDFVLAYKLLHVSGEHEAGEYPLPKSGTPQAMGAAISYARRYALCAVTGVAPKGDDDDAAEAPKATTAQRKARPARQQAEPAPAPPRTAQRARVDGPPLPGDDAPKGPAMITGPQRGMVLALFDKAGIAEREERLDISRRVVGRAELASANALTSTEASRLIDWLTKAEADGFTEALGRLVGDGQETLPVDDGRSALARAQAAGEGT